MIFWIPLITWFMVIRYKLLWLFLSICLGECKNQESLSTTLPVQPIPILGGFDDFYQRFHLDSGFQMKHIRFPLEGLPEQADTSSMLESYRWTEDKWILHRPIDLKDTLFYRSFKTLDSSMIIEVIKHKFSPMQMERRFSKSDSEWSLIYYAPLRTPITIEIR